MLICIAKLLKAFGADLEELVFTCNSYNFTHFRDIFITSYSPKKKKKKKTRNWVPHTWYPIIYTYIYIYIYIYIRFGLALLLCFSQTFKTFLMVSFYLWFRSTQYFSIWTSKLFNLTHWHDSWSLHIPKVHTILSTSLKISTTFEYTTSPNNRLQYPNIWSRRGLVGSVLAY